MGNLAQAFAVAAHYATTFLIDTYLGHQGGYTKALLILQSWNDGDTARTLAHHDASDWVWNYKRARGLLK